MSPTSYQTAPPREGMIADAEQFVKRASELAAKTSYAKQAHALQLCGASEFFPDGRVDLQG